MFGISDAWVTQLGGVLVAVITSGCLLAGVLINTRRQKQPRVVELADDDLIVQNYQLRRRAENAERMCEVWKAVALDRAPEVGHIIEGIEP